MRHRSDTGSHQVVGMFLALGNAEHFTLLMAPLLRNSRQDHGVSPFTSSKGSKFSPTTTTRLSHDDDGTARRGSRLLHNNTAPLDSKSNERARRKWLIFRSSTYYPDVLVSSVEASSPPLTPMAALTIAKGENGIVPQAAPRSMTTARFFWLEWRTGSPDDDPFVGDSA